LNFRRSEIDSGAFWDTFSSMARHAYKLQSLLLICYALLIARIIGYACLCARDASLTKVPPLFITTSSANVVWAVRGVYIYMPGAAEAGYEWSGSGADPRLRIE